MTSAPDAFFRTVPVGHWRPARVRGPGKVLIWSEARIAFLYVFFGCLWILFFDRILDLLGHDPGGSALLTTWSKGINFLVTTSLLLYLVLRRILGRWRQAEQKFHAIEERFEYAGRVATDAIWEWDFVTDTIWVSESFSKLFGYTRAEMDPVSFAWNNLVQNVHPEDRDRLRTTARQTIDGGGKMWTVEYRYRRKDGSYASVEGHGYVIRDETGQALRAIGCATDVTARKLATEKLERSRRQLRSLSARLQNLREEERTRIAREIHDELGQTLTGLKMDLRWAEKRLTEAANPAMHPVLDRLLEAGELVDATIASVQRISAELRLSLLDDLGLPAALKQEAQRFQERSGITCAVRAPELSFSVSQEKATPVFRIFQEALTNVARHAGASTVEVQLGAESGQLVLQVIDNGKGIQLSDIEDPKSLGLFGMRERAELLGGEISFQPGGRGGTVVTLRIPLDAAPP